VTSRGMTLNQALRSRGYYTQTCDCRRARFMPHKAILSAGKVVTCGDAEAVWTWLHEQEATRNPNGDGLGGPFLCPHCGRWVPEEQGAADDRPEACDDCWARLEEQKESA